MKWILLLVLLLEGIPMIVSATNQQNATNASVDFETFGNGTAIPNNTDIRNIGNWTVNTGGADWMIQTLTDNASRQSNYARKVSASSVAHAYINNNGVFRNYSLPINFSIKFLPYNWTSGNYPNSAVPVITFLFNGTNPTTSGYRIRYNAILGTVCLEYLNGTLIQNINTSTPWSTQFAKNQSFDITGSIDFNGSGLDVHVYDRQNDSYSWRYRGKGTITSPERLIGGIGFEAIANPNVDTAAYDDFQVSSSAPLYNISGYIQYPNGTAVSGITVTENQENQTNVSNDTGFYSFTGMVNNTYIISVPLTSTLYDNSTSIILSGADMQNVSIIVWGKGSWANQTYYSTSLQEQRIHLIWKPWNYSNNIQNPLVVWTHGMGVSALTDPWNMPNTTKFADKFGYIVLSVQAGSGSQPNGTNSNWWYNNITKSGIYYQLFESLVFDTLQNITADTIDFNISVDKTYAAGSSMGGYGALKNTMKSPDIFAAVGVMSPATASGMYNETGDANVKSTWNSTFGNYSSQTVRHQVNAPRLLVNNTKYIPKWFWHGTGDGIIYQSSSENLNISFNSIGDTNFTYVNTSGAHTSADWGVRIEPMFTFFNGKIRGSRPASFDYFTGYNRSIVWGYNFTIDMQNETELVKINNITSGFIEVISSYNVTITAPNIYITDTNYNINDNNITSGTWNNYTQYSDSFGSLNFTTGGSTHDVYISEVSGDGAVSNLTRSYVQPARQYRRDNQ